MKLTDYQEQASRTAVSLGDERLDISHMLQGLTSELPEVFEAIKDKVNMSEELADMHWYLANLARIRDIDYDTFKDVPYRMVKTMSEEEAFINLTMSVGNLTDIYKKHIAYGKEISKGDEMSYIATVFLHLNQMYHIFELDINQSLQNNIDKLKVRFPDKFESKNALNRDLEQERKKLEKNI